MNKEQIIDEVYENWCKQFEVDPNNFNVDELVKGHGDQCWGYPILDHVKPTSKEYKRGQINAYLEGKADRPFFYLSKEEFINKCKTDSEFSEKWGLKIEERELRLEERLEIADKFNPLIREDCLTKTHHPDETEELKLIYRHAWLDSLGPNVVPQRKLITITYNDKTIESYE
jgi:hypothetical protein